MIELKGVSKTYKPKKGPAVKALKNVSLKLDDVGLVFVLGKSGCGKSTLLNCIGGLDRIDGGEIIINGKSSAAFSQSDFDSYRNTYLGFIFQEYNIIQDFTVGANIGLALELQGKKATKEAINSILAEVELEGYGNRKPNELSGGQKQRVAIARALVKSPEIILADEPTGALDSKTGVQVFDTLKHLSKTRLVLVVSHDREFAEQYADRIITLADGVVIDDVQKNTERAQEVTSGLKVIKDRVIHINKGYALSAEELVLIRQFVLNSQNDTVISLDGKINENIRKTSNITAEGIHVFKQTKEDNIAVVEGKSFYSIRSRLPVKDAFKIGASAFQNKKFRLVMTILLSVFAFVLFALTDTMAVYNMQNALLSSIYDAKLANLTYEKYSAFGSESEFDVYYNKDFFSEQDLKTLSAKSGAEMKGVYSNYNLSVFSDSLYADYTYGSYYGNSASGFIDGDKEYLEQLGFSITGNYPSNYSEIAITDYIYQSFYKYDYKEGREGTARIAVNSKQDIIGKTIYLGLYSFTVTGVIDTGFNSNGEYDILKEENSKDVLEQWLRREVANLSMQAALKYGYHGLIFGAKGFTSYLADEIAYYAAISTVDLAWKSSLFYTVTDEEGWNSKTYIKYILKLSDIDSGSIDWVGEVKTSLGENEILLPKSLKNKSEASYNLTQQFYGNDTTGNFTVVGYFEPKPDSLPSENAEAWVVPQALYEKFYEQSQKIYGSAIAPMHNSKVDIQNALDLSGEKQGGYYYEMQNEILVALRLFDNIFDVLKKVFVYLGMAFAVFASLQFANYISVSISYKKKDIGILRAIGARGADVYSIFFAESLIIALINFTLSAVIAAVVSIAANLVVHKSGLPISLLNFGIRQIAILAGICILVAAAASFLPVYKLARKKPIDTINDR